MKSLLSIGNDAKTVKGEKKGYLTGILYLAPANESGVANLCPHASVGCRAACLFTAGRGSFDSVKWARIAKTVSFKEDREQFLAELALDIARLQVRAVGKKMVPCVRLNGTSDLPWHNLGIMEKFPTLQFYDYTPNAKRAVQWSQGQLPSNYHLTFSRKEDNQQYVELLARMSRINIAVVFAGKDKPKEYLGREVINGDESDLRFLDPERVIVGLSAKGRGKRDTSGFVVDGSNLGAL